MRFLFAVDDEPVTRGTPLRPVSVGMLLAAGAGTVVRYLLSRHVERGAAAR